jgi:hypothetical protein
MNQHSSTDSTFSSIQGVSAEAISRRAYEIWEREGRPEGQDLRHWLQAEQELGVHRSEEPPQPQSTSSRSSTDALRTPAPDTRPLHNRPTGTSTSPRDTKRGSGVVAGADKGAGNGQNAAKRKPSNAPIM